MNDTVSSGNLQMHKCRDTWMYCDGKCSTCLRATWTATNATTLQEDILDENS